MQSWEVCYSLHSLEHGPLYGDFGSGRLEVVAGMKTLTALGTVFAVEETRTGPKEEMIEDKIEEMTVEPVGMMEGTMHGRHRIRVLSTFSVRNFSDILWILRYLCLDKLRS